MKAPVSSQVLRDLESQNNQGSLEETLVQPSVNTLNRSNQEDLTNTPPKVARFEMETSTISWELLLGQTEYIHGSSYVPDKNINDKILGDNSI